MTDATILSFSEQLSGSFAWGQIDPRVGEEIGKHEQTWLGLRAEIVVVDLDLFLRDRSRAADLRGTLFGNLFGAERPELRGSFSFHASGPGGRRIEVYATFTARGRGHVFAGVKRLDAGPLGLRALTTMYGTIVDEAGAVIAAGVLRMPLLSGPRFLAGLRVSGPRAGLPAKLEFLRLFLRDEVAELLREGTPEAPRRRTLSRPHERLAGRYDVVVVGSGYGGGATAARLAAWRGRDGRGRRVALLERGREWRAGDFPDDPLALTRALRHAHNPGGLFDFQLRGDVDAVVGNGLGGTSLINASVMIRPQPWVHRCAEWPDALPDLGPYYDRAEAVLRPTPDPEPPLKSAQFLRAAEGVPGCTAAEPVRLAVTFAEGARDDTGNHQTACTRCGGCVSGCNFAAKSTVDLTYVSIAERQGCEVFTELEVRSIERCPGGVRLHLRDHAERRERVVEAGQVVLAAGVYGTFAILARSRAAGLAVSEALGERFNGNGDVIGFAYNCDVRTEQSRGATITAVAKFWDESWPARERLIIEEGGVPRALGLLGKVLPFLRQHDTDEGLEDRLHELLRAGADVAGAPALGASERSLMFLAMGFEERLGRLCLEGDRVRVVWPGAEELGFAERANAGMAAITERIGGSFVQHPAPDTPRTQLLLAHPLGGCVIGDDPRTSVVDVRGALHGHADRIFVADGSLLPMPLGVNPALTIAALSEYVAEQIAARW